MNTPSLASRAAALPSNGAERRDEILRVACDLFYSKGFEAASMRDIAQQIGFTQAAIYYHFRSKDEILVALIDGFTAKLHALLDQKLHETGDLLNDFQRAVHAHIMLTKTDYREIKVVQEDKKLLSQPLADHIREREISIYELYKSRIEELIGAGQCTSTTPTVAAFTTLGAINFVYQWYRPGASLKLGAIADQTVHMLTHGLIGQTPDADGPVKRSTRRRS